MFPLVWLEKKKEENKNGVKKKNTKQPISKLAMQNFNWYCPGLIAQLIEVHRETGS